MLLAKKSCIIGLALLVGQALAIDDFVIKKTPNQKKYSTSHLKELIGQETKQLFNQTTKLGMTLAGVHENVARLQKNTLTTKKPVTGLLEGTANIHGLCGKLNKELALVQNHCSSLIESLIDDQPPFKKAAKQDLNEALSSLESICSTLEQSVNSCQTWCSKAKQVPSDIDAIQKSIGTLCTNLDQCVSSVSNARTTMNGKRCLKMA